MLRLSHTRALGCAVLSLALTGTALASASAANFPAAKRAAQLLYATTLDWNAGNGTVYVYHAYGKNTSPIRQIAIAAGFPDGVWTDPKGDVYVSVVNAGNGGHGYINEYSPGGTTLLQTYTGGLNGPSGGAFDAAGNMYVADLCTPNQNYSCGVFAWAGNLRGVNVARNDRSATLSGFIGVYPPGSTQPSEQLQSPVLNIPVTVAVDKAQNIFASDNTGEANWNVVEFPAGSGTAKVAPLLGLPNDAWVGAVAFNQANALVVGTNESINIYPREHGKPATVLTSGLFAPDGLAFGADGTLFAGNYEFENNEGNILAFPPGSNTPTRSFAVPYGNGVVAVAVGDAR